MKPAVPEQHTGAQSNTTRSITTNTPEDAVQLFNKARKNLLCVNSWEELAGKHSAAFQLMNKKGEPVLRIPQVGDYFRINIPGPDNDKGHGYDWVQVEAIEEDLQNSEQAHTAIRVRSSDAPGDEAEAAHHFFTKEATSTFCVQRKHNTVTAGVYGRNEKSNTDSGRLFTKIRNAFIGFFAMLGFNKPQWASLVKGILEKDADAVTFQK